LAGCGLAAGTLKLAEGDKGPRHHPITGPNISPSSTPHTARGATTPKTFPHRARARTKGVFLVRHTAVPYYLGEVRACTAGQTDLRRLPQDTAAGTLPDYSLVIPNSCHDMHGDPTCPTGWCPPATGCCAHGYRASPTAPTTAQGASS
jgi:hypothetical protein